jgi:hypothetical protein
MTATLSSAETVVEEAPFDPDDLDIVTLGKTWERDAFGRFVEPEQTLGWEVLAWCTEWLQHADGTPWRFTNEQVRFVLWFYAIDADGLWLAHDVVLQRMKGWGKDPLAAVIAAVEIIGPARFGGWDPDGNPLAIDNPVGYVQVYGVAKDQTKNTMRLFPSLFTPAAVRRFDLDINKEIVYALGGSRVIEAMTSSAATSEGGRPTLVIANETHHWKSNNGGHDVEDTLQRNLAKAPYGTARRLAITNAFNPAEDSVAQRDREAFEAMQSGEVVDVGMMYDTLEAGPRAQLTAEQIPFYIAAVRGDAVWISIESGLRFILDKRRSPSSSRRFWFNQVVSREDSWTEIRFFDIIRDVDVLVDPAEEIVLFFDGSKSDDATALVGCRVSDGHVLTFGMWQAPPQARRGEWVVPRGEVDARVREVFELHNVVAFFGDPSHTFDDETLDRFWDSLFDDWHRRYNSQLRLWATPGRGGHSIMWDMTDTERVRQFTAAAELAALDIAGEEFTHDGDPRLRAHVMNAVRYPNRYGVSIWKGHRESARKIDLAVCMIGARMLRRMLLNLAEDPKKQRTGRGWGMT